METKVSISKAIVIENSIPKQLEGLYSNKFVCAFFVELHPKDFKTEISIAPEYLLGKDGAQYSFRTNTVFGINEVAKNEDIYEISYSLFMYALNEMIELIKKHHPDVSTHQFIPPTYQEMLPSIQKAFHQKPSSN